MSWGQLPESACGQLEQLWTQQPELEAVVLYGSRAMGRQRPGSDLDLTLRGPRLQHQDLLGLMQAIDDLLLPWSVDLSLEQELPQELRDHIARVGQVVWQRAAAPAFNPPAPGAGPG
jgi:predicted nucleotidyltransferase